MNKKIICLLLCIALCLSMLACGKKAQKDTLDPAAPTNAADPESATQQTNAAGEVITPTGNGADAQQDAETATKGQENTTAAAGQTNTQPTLPPEVEVSMGVVEGEDDGGIDEDFDDAPSTQPPVTTPTTQPAGGGSQIGEDFDIRQLTYEGYNAMSGEDQKKVIDMFGSTDDFMRWYKAMEAQYKEAHPDVEIGGDGSINAGDLAG